ncbi:MAG: FAD-binding protein [Candidatus Marinimicrobia bacterium]|nr:FAD-binding protein [Candidatus Neomarinimicrobiota bacterium]
MSKYNKLTKEMVAELQQIVGDRNVIYDDQGKLETYSHDEVNDEQYAQMPDIVIKPENAEEISKIMKLANRENVPVTPRGAGSGLSGGAVPVEGGIVLSLERMDKIIEIDEDNLIAVVEPGVITNEINELIAEKGLFYAGYPMSVESCFIGGNVAENAGGGRAVKYGVTGRYILGLEMVTPEGEIIHLGGKRVKDVVGYDLVKLMVGSEGTLGIFTKIYLKLLPLPQHTVNLLVLYEDIETAIKQVPPILTDSKTLPTAIEFMDKESVLLVYKYLNEHLPLKGANAMLLIELDGSDEDVIEKAYHDIGDKCLENGALEVYVANSATTRERVWRIRRNIPEAIQTYSEYKSSEDIVVPIANIPDFLIKSREIAKNNGVDIYCFGHAGDGNIHSTIVKRSEMEKAEWDEQLEKTRSLIFEETVKMGGTISGEHGIGNKRKKYMKNIMKPATLELMRRVKLAFDPNNILNPGKIFDTGNDE